MHLDLKNLRKNKRYAMDLFYLTLMFSDEKGNSKNNFELQKEYFLVHIYLTTVSRFPERKFDAFFIANGETLGFFASCAQFVR